MAETFCGKNCDLCQEKLSEECRGCKEGPGRRFGGNCPIADCCREKYHANCDTCQEAMSCTKRQQKDQMQQIRIAEAAAKEEKEVQKREKAKVLGKWLWLLFWLLIPNIIAGIMSNESLKPISPTMYYIGTVLDSCRDYLLYRTVYAAACRKKIWTCCDLYHCWCGVDCCELALGRWGIVFRGTVYVCDSGSESGRQLLPVLWPCSCIGGF